MTLLRHIARTGCTIAGVPVWTAEEIAHLRQTPPDRKAACLALPRRTPGAMAHKARQLGLIPPRKIWIGDEAVRLRKPYVAGVSITELLEIFPGKTRSQTWRKASEMGYRRPRRAPKPTGMALVDSIRQRAFACRLTMTDLDAYVGGNVILSHPVISTGVHVADNPTCCQRSGVGSARTRCGARAPAIPQLVRPLLLLKWASERPIKCCCCLPIARSTLSAAFPVHARSRS